MKCLFGTAIAVLLSAAVAPSVVAEPMTGAQMSQEQLALQNARPDWEVQSVKDGQLTVKMKGGDAMQTFMISPETSQELNLRPGSVIELNYDNVMVGTVASATQTNIEVDFEDRERATYLIPESGNDYDLGDQVLVTPDRLLGKVSEWQISAADVTVLAAETDNSSTSVSTSTPVTTEVRTETEVKSEVEPVPGLW